MNRKWIKRRLAKVHKEFVDSIKDPVVQAAVRDNSIITGGCIASLLLNEKPRDYDYYFTDLPTTLAVAKHFAQRYNDEAKPNIPTEVMLIDSPAGPATRIRLNIKSAGIASTEQGDKAYQYFESRPDDEGVDYAKNAFDAIKNNVEDGDDIPITVVEEIAADEKKTKREKYSPIFLSMNAITLLGSIQLVTRFYGTPEQVHENFDFIHCTNFWHSSNGELVLNQRALESLMSKQLYYHGSRYPLCSVIRTRKFLKRGWVINAGQYLKMCFQLSQLDLSDINVLEEQLTGVDTAYFTQLIDICKEQIAKDENFRIDDLYISSLVDRLF